MTRKTGYPTWPPQWTTTHQDKNDKPIGEVGILEDVMMSKLIDNKVFIFMRCEGFRYMGFMGFDDLMFCRDMYILFKVKGGSLHQRCWRPRSVIYALRPTPTERIEDHDIGPLWAEHFPKRKESDASNTLCLVLMNIINDRSLSIIPY